MSQDHNIIIKLHGFSWEQRKYHYQNILCSELSKNNPDIHLLPNEEFDIIGIIVSNSSNGVEINKIDKKSNAYRSGLRSGDIILSIENKKIEYNINQKEEKIIECF